jgi:hypothetical protein
MSSVSRLTSFPMANSHIRTVLSQLPDTTYAVRGYRHTPDMFVAGEESDFLTGGQFPEPQRSVISPRHDIAAIRSYRNALHVALVPGQSPYLIPGGQLPYPHGLVFASRYHIPAVLRRRWLLRLGAPLAFALRTANALQNASSEAPGRPAPGKFRSPARPAATSPASLPSFAHSGRPWLDPYPPVPTAADHAPRPCSHPPTCLESALLGWAISAASGLSVSGTGAGTEKLAFGVGHLRDQRSIGLRQGCRCRKVHIRNGPFPRPAIYRSSGIGAAAERSPLECGIPPPTFVARFAT